jgi:putative membrane protein
VAANWTRACGRWPSGPRGSLDLIGGAVTHVDLQKILTTWKGDPGTVALYTVLLALAIAYGVSASRRSPRGRRWPVPRTVSFLAGLALLAVIYGSGLQVYEDQPAVHVVQHMLTMMAVPPLLVLGAPITLLLRTLPSRRRPAVTGLLDDPAFAMLSGPRAPLMLSADYYLTMFVYQLTPLHTWSEQSVDLHFIVHQYFLLCGLFFWWPVVAVDPVRLRLSSTAKWTMVALGLPAFALLGGVELATGATTTGVAYLACGAALTLIGGVVVAVRARGGWGVVPVGAVVAPRALGESSVSGSV